MPSHVTGRNAEASSEDVVSLVGLMVSHLQCVFIDYQVLTGGCYDLSSWGRPVVGEGVVTGSIGEEADSACQSGHLIHPTLSSDHCPHNLQGRVRL